MNEHEWQEIIGTLGIFVLLIAVLVTVLWQGAVTMRAKARLAGEGEYKKLAEDAVAGQRRIEEELAGLGSQISDLRTRTESMEKVLKDVE